jgi:hypothetical protein
MHMQLQPMQTAEIMAPAYAMLVAGLVALT